MVISEQVQPIPPPTFVVSDVGIFAQTCGSLFEIKITTLCRVTQEQGKEHGWY